MALTTSSLFTYPNYALMGYDTGSQHNKSLTDSAAQLTELSNSSSKHDGNLNAEVKIKNGKILKDIFAQLPLRDLLNCRRVCYFWDKIICTTAGEPNLLWSKTCLTLRKPLPQKTLKPFTSVDTEMNKDTLEWNLWKSLHQSPLISLYKCPNLHLDDLDLRRECVQDFFMEHGSQIEHLKITRCQLSLITFQKIVAFCPNLVYFKMKPVPYHSIIYCESLTLQPRALQPTNIWFRHVRTLILYSDYKKHFYGPNTNGLFSEFRDQKRKPYTNFIADNIFSVDYIENHLQPSVVDEIIFVSPALAEIQLYGWTGDTITNVLKSLVRHRRSGIKRLEFHDILLMFDSEELEAHITALTALADLRLESFALTFLNPLSLYDIVNSKLNSIVRRVLLTSAKSLVSVNLKNCSSIDESIFGPLRFDPHPIKELWFNNLEVLELAGTNVRRLSKYAKYMPKLKLVNFKILRHEDDVITEEDQLEKEESEYHLHFLYEQDSPDRSSSLNEYELEAWGLQNPPEVIKPIYSFVSGKVMPTLGEQLGFMAQLMLVGLAICCGYLPFFVELTGTAGTAGWPFFICIVLSSLVFISYKLKERDVRIESDALDEPTPSSSSSCGNPAPASSTGPAEDAPGPQQD